MSGGRVSAGPAPREIEARCDALLLVDVDEVVLHFIQPLRELLAEHGARLHPDSFRLTGNVRSISTGAAVIGHKLDRITQQLYREQERRQRPVAGAREALASLSAVADVVFLTSMTPVHHAARRRVLDEAGLPYPMVATERSKGAVAAELAASRPGPLVFVDDLPQNLEGVRRSVPDARLVHLMADDAFRALLPPLPPGAVAAADWPDAVHRIRGLLAAA